MSPQMKTVTGASLKSTRAGTRGRTGYQVPAPTIKREIADRIRAVEAAAVAPRAVNSRCCGKCKTPYNCGRPGCPCHS